MYERLAGSTYRTRYPEQVAKVLLTLMATATREEVQAIETAYTERGPTC